jgi:hypothetical protein
VGSATETLAYRAKERASGYADATTQHADGSFGAGQQFDGHAD